MFIAMNRFKVHKDATEKFEAVWRNRESRLPETVGFMSFHLLRGPVAEDHILYVSHSTWRSKADFTVWRKSPQFREAHSRAPMAKPLYAGPPQFEGFEVVQTVPDASAKTAD